MDSSTPEPQPTVDLPQPDLMNDPAFETNGKGKERQPDEGDTCRICRGEGSATEPLFYPCRCSGSIKFVHQECLMGWLSHSQKKHCELCKTPFRFTKLYHPQMPSTVPIWVFLRRASWHCLRSFMTVARWLLVLGIWLGWVPWCMRIVWRGLFWVGDGGWITPQEIERRTALQLQELALLQPTSPALSHLPSPTTPATNALSAAFGNVRWNPFQLAFGTRAEEPLMLRIAKNLYRIVLYPAPKRTDNITLSATGHTFQRPGSLLSDYPLVSNFTRSATLNNLAVDILEGQLIALLVVVGFILVFLIREWVVQQQPAINAGQVAAEVNANVHVHDEPQEAEVEDIPQHVFEPDHDETTGVLAGIAADQHNLGRTETQVVFTLPARISANDENQELNDSSSHTADSTSLDNNSRIIPSSESITVPPGSSRPPLPHRGALTPATEIQRTLEEEALVSGHVWPGVDVFMDLWRRAESDPEEVLRLIQADGRENELAWIVSAMNRLQQGLPLRQGNDAMASTAFAAANVEETHSSSANSSWLLIDGESERGRDLHGDINAQTSAQVTLPANKPSPTLEPTEWRQARPEELRNHGELDTWAGESTTSEIDAGVGLLLDPEKTDGDRVTAGPSSDGILMAPKETPPHSSSSAEGTAGPTDPNSNDGLNEQSGRNEPNAPVQVVDRAVRDNTWTHAIQQWFWGDIPEVPAPAEDPGQDDEHVVEDVADEAPFVRVADGQLLLEDGNEEEDEEPPVELDPEVLQAAAEAGINPNEADIEDAEDLEGILELIGAQGPLIGLFQNGMFCAVLIAIAFFAGVWIPYITGKLVLVFLANPIPLLLKMPLQWTSYTADLLVDVLITAGGWSFYAIDALVKLTVTPIGWILPFIKHISQDNILGKIALKYAHRSMERLGRSFVAGGDFFRESDVPIFSIVAHESLKETEATIIKIASAVVSGVGKSTEILTSNTTAIEKLFVISHELLKNAGIGFRWLATLLASVTPGVLSSLRSFPISINIDTPDRTHPIDYSLAYWSTQDKIIAVLIGYSFVFLLGAVYLRISTALRSGEIQKAGDFNDVLKQAGGVIKVILIISIEMIVFPLYCGALLDAALLPLFDRATVASRLKFTVEAPMTSTFIHWFIGTCYMFHFALFVSMCRKLMRTGVLYFIRDPDDPSFHPVRDVLEKNVYTQLRKIAFSAIVYGGLVLICLGTVVWTISKTTSGILPIRWASSRPVLEYPVDLLVYNLVMPIAMTFFKPGTILTAIYNWWFRKCARWLRLTHFLFGEKREEEMWKFVRDPFHNLRIKDETNPEDYLAEEQHLLQAREIASFFPTGHFVRAPASDQVRLQKGSRTFVPVDEHGNRTDGVPDSNQGPHGRNNRMFKKIFIPHRFKLRISAFILLLWLFAAATGISCTIGPLLFGRLLFAHLLPPKFIVNDVYAFAMGAYLLGGPLYLAVRFRAPIQSVLRKLYKLPTNGYFALSSLRSVLQQATGIATRGLRLLYFYAGLGLLFPLLLGLLWETYVIIPMLTFLHPLPAPPYTIRFVQSWTLAVIALKYAVKIALVRPDTRPSRALRALVSPENRGAKWTDPDVRLATRAFVLPALAVVLVALVVPFAFAAFMLAVFRINDEAGRAVVYRYAYPVMLSLGITVLAVQSLGQGLKLWREKVRDEVFLVGERLHNFGERQASSGAPNGQTGSRSGHDVQRVDVRA